MRTFLRSQARRHGGYTPEELSMLDQVCKAAVSRLGLTSHDEIDDLAAGILSLYDAGSNDPEEILRAATLAFSTGRRLTQRRAVRTHGIAVSKVPPPPKPLVSG